MPFPIVDTHVHFWDPSNLRYPWLDRSELLNRPYLPADYIAAAGPVEVGRIVFVQAACIREQAMEEVAWVTALAADEPRIQGIVADAPLELGAGAAPVLERLAGNPLVKGVRRMLQGEKEPEFCLQPGFVEGTKRLGQAGLSFDMGITRHQLPAVTDLARRCPEVRFMLCHIGVPDIRGGQLDPWREQLRDLAALPNVYCKLSGVATAADPQTWTREDLRPAIDHVFDCFRFERVAFGSDWPVMLRATPFPRWAATAAWATAECTAAERRRVFRDTAESFYGLGGA
ncbi:MAG: amidohydrolase family protein [Candidatus Hydrogenedentes bacterium]|nr:amidohydrolase family protein [Candidatus Hydrogenedentota bacterium]